MLGNSNNNSMLVINNKKSHLISPDAKKVKVLLPSATANTNTNPVQNSRLF